MIYYINTDRRRLVGRNNQPAALLPDLADYTRAELTFSFVDSQNKIVELTELPGGYLAGAVKLGKSSSSLLFFSNDFVIADNQITFTLDLRAKTIADQITKANSEIWIELGAAPAADSQRVLLRDNALISPRVWHEGDGPDVPDVSTYYTKIQTDSLLALKQDLITEDAKLSYQLVSGMPPVPTKVSQLENDSGYQTAGDVEAAVSGKQPLITSEAKLGYDLVSGTPDLAEYQPLITPEAKLDFALVSGVPEYATPADVEAATSGKADSSAVETALALKEDIINSQHKVAFDNISGVPEYATPADVDAVTSGKLDAPAGGSEGQVLTKTAEGSEWADPQAGAAVQPYNLPVSAPSAGQKWFSAASEDWTREFPPEQKAVFLTYTSGGFLNFPRVKSTANTGNIRTLELWANMPSGSVSGFTIPAKYQASNMPEVISGEGGGNYWYGGGGGDTHNIFVMRFLDDGSNDCPVRLNFADEWKTGGAPAISSWLTLQVVDPKTGTARIGTTGLDTTSGVYSVDGGEWQAIPNGTIDLSNLSAGTKIRFGANMRSGTGMIRCISGATFKLYGDERTLTNSQIPSGSFTVGFRYYGVASMPMSGLAEVGELDTANSAFGTGKFAYNAELVKVDGWRASVAAGSNSSASGAFANCPKLQSVNEDMFDGVSGRLILTDAFANCGSLTGAPSLAASERVTGDRAFMNCSSLVSGPDIGEHVISAKQMFFGCSSMSGFPGPLNMPEVKDLSGFCSGAGLRSIELNASGASGMPEAFADCQGLETAAVTGGTACTNLTGMFRNCPSLTGAALSIPTSSNPSTYPYFQQVFKNCGSLVSADFPVGYKPSYVDSAFENCSSLTSIGSGLNFASIFSATNAFKNCVSLQTVPDNLRVQSIIANSNISGMFQGCSSLAGIGQLGITYFTWVQNLFDGCSSLTAPSAAYTFNLSHAKDVSYAFRNCVSLTDIGHHNYDNWDWPAVTGAAGAFQNCTALTGFHEGFDLPKAQTVNYMLSGCSSLSSLPDSFKLSSAINLSVTFKGCSSLSALPSGFLPSGATNVEGMFYGCSSLSALPSGFTLPNATSAGSLFYGCSSLSALPDNFSLESMTSDANLFTSCRNIRHIGANVKIGAPSKTVDISYMFVDVASRLTSIGQNFIFYPGAKWGRTYDPDLGIKNFFPNLTAEGTPTTWRVYDYDQDGQVTA